MSSFTIIADMEGKVQHCLYDGTSIQFAIHIGAAFDEFFDASIHSELQDFLTGTQTRETPDHMTILMSGDVTEMMMLSRIDCEPEMVLTGTTVSPDGDTQSLAAIEQVHTEQLETIRNVLMLENYPDAINRGSDETEETAPKETLLIAQRKVYQLKLELNRHQKQMIRLSRMNSAMQMCNNLEELYKVIGIFTEKLFDSVGGSLYIFRPEVNRFEVCVHWGNKIGSSDKDVGGESFIDLLNQQSSQQKITGFLSDQGKSNCLLLRIPEDSSMIGVLQICLQKKISTTNRFFAHYQQTFLRMIGLSITNMRYRLWLDQDAMQDHLTNLYNRRFLSMQLEREFNRALRQGSFLSVVMLDLDDFTGLNVTYGHLTGDQYLIEFGKVLTRCVRKEDYVCRYGKDEFTLILVDSAQEDALMILDRVKAECKAVRVSGLTIPMPFSSGVATFPTDARSPDEVLKRAEEVLYLMKRRKRQAK